MVTLRKNKVVYCDIDMTLIMWNGDDTWTRNDKHINLLRQFKLQGFGLVAWSAGGYEWAQKAVEMLGLEEIFDICINKPDWHIDDKSSIDFMPEANRIYIR
jgi:predicted HAD superfamily phosphohydrolase YqeG